MMELLLNGEWKMKATDEKEWLTATVPGSVMHELLKQEKIADPFYRDNEDEAYDISSKDYEFVRDFEVSEDLLRQDYIILRCEGLDTLSEVYMNDRKIVSTSNMHRVYEIDVRSYVKLGNNSIKIMLFSPTDYIKEKHVKQPLPGVEHSIEGYQYIRKAHSMFGWDWGPKIPDLGIWRDIALVGWNAARIDDLYIRQNHSLANQVELEMQISLEKVKEDKLDLEATVTYPDGKVITKAIETIKDKDSISVLIDDPQMWWPNGYGEQPLYEVEVTLRSEGVQLDAKQLRIGLRTIEIKHEPDEWGQSFEFVINGISIFAMGANYIPEDSLLPRVTPTGTERLIKDCVEANFNMIRVWGGGYYLDDYFYDLCDEYGLIVWQDFMFACSVYDVTKNFEDNVRQESIDNIKRIRHHASLGLWCGNNEVEEGWESWGWPERSKFKSHYVKLFEVILPKLVEELDPETFYWPSSPSSGGAFDRPNNPLEGDVHYWDVWHGLKPFTEYRKFNFRFCSEFGFQSFPSLKTVETYTEEKDRNIFSYVMEKHQKNDGANGKILTYLADTFLYPKSFDSLLYTSQLLQGEAIKYGVEHWRRNRGISMGSLYWQLNDCWPVASWASIDYFGRWKALHYFAKKFYAPVLLSIKDEETSAEIHITNETLKPITPVINWKLRTNEGDILQEGKVVQEVQALTASLCKSLDFENILDKDMKRKTYLEAIMYMDGEEMVATCLFTQPKHFEFLNPEIQLEIKETDEHFEITISVLAFAKYIELDLTASDCKFSDNYFELSPGRQKTIIVKKDSLSHHLDAEEFLEQLKLRSIYDVANE